MKRDRLLLAGLGALIAVFLTVMAGLLYSQPASAVGGTVSVTPPRTKLLGQTDTVNLTVNVPTPGLGSWTIDIAYDTSVLEVVSCTSNSNGYCNISATPNKVRSGGLYFSSPPTTATVVATFTFRCIAVGSPNTLTVELPAGQDPLNDFNGDPVTPVTENNGTFNCNAVTPSPSPTPSPSATPSPSSTPTPSPSASATPSATPSGSPTGSPTASPSLSPSPSPTFVAGLVRWTDVRCDATVDAVDSLLILRQVAQLSVSQVQPCPSIGALLELLSFSPQKWGDADCDGDVDAVDALKVLRRVADLSVDQEEGCPDIGAVVMVTGQGSGSAGLPGGLLLAPFSALAALALGGGSWGLRRNRRRQ